MISYLKKEKISFLESSELRESDMIKINLTLILTRISLIVIKNFVKNLFNILWSSILGLICQIFFLKSVKILVLGHYLAI